MYYKQDGLAQPKLFKARDETDLLRYCKCNGKVTFTRPFLLLGKVILDEHVNVLEKVLGGDTGLSYTLTKPQSLSLSSLCFNSPYLLRGARSTLVTGARTVG